MSALLRPLQLPTSQMTIPQHTWIRAVWILSLVGLFDVSGAVAQIGATPASQISVPANFHVELLYSVPNDTQGSWVTLTYDPQGRLVTSAQILQACSRYFSRMGRYAGTSSSSRVLPMLVVL